MDDSENPVAAIFSQGGFANSLPEEENPVAKMFDPNLARSSIAGRTMKRAIGEAWDYDKTKDELGKYGVEADTVKGLKGQLGLSAARKKAAEEGESGLTIYRRKYLPFSDVVGTNWTGVGGRVVGNSEYSAAAKRFAEGGHTDDDLHAIATYEEAKKTDEVVAKMKGAGGFGLRLADSLGGLGKIGGEMAAGGAALSRVGRLGSAARAGSAAAAAGAAIPAAASLGSAVATGIGSAAAKTALAPSMWVPHMQQRNMQEGRDPNSPVGLPTAFGYGMANMAVLGRLQTGMTSGSVMQSFAKGSLGLAELQGVDLVSGYIDELLPDKYGAHGKGERYGTIGELGRAFGEYRHTRDSEKIQDAIEKIGIQALSFSAFAYMHGKTPEFSKDLLGEYRGAAGSLVKGGKSKAEAASDIADLHQKLEDALSAEPYLDRAGAEAALRDVPAPLKKYADKLADTFEPQAKPKEPVPEAKPATGVAPPPEATPVSETAKTAEPAPSVESRVDPRLDTTPPELASPLPKPEPRSSFDASVEDKLSKGAGREEAIAATIREKMEAAKPGTLTPEPPKPSPVSQPARPKVEKIGSAAQLRAAAAARQEARQPKQTASSALESPETPLPATEKSTVLPDVKPEIVEKRAGSVKLGAAEKGGATRTGKTISGETINRHAITDAAGKEVGHADVIDRGEDVHVEWIGRQGASVSEAKKFAGSIGASGVRDLVRGLAEKYPSATYITGLRTTGARTKAGKADQRAKTRIPGRKGPENRTEDKPATPDVTAGKSAEWIATYESMKSLVGEKTAAEIADKDHGAAAAAGSINPMEPVDRTPKNRLGRRVRSQGVDESAFDSPVATAKAKLGLSKPVQPPRELVDEIVGNRKIGDAADRFRAGASAMEKVDKLSAAQKVNLAATLRPDAPTPKTGKEARELIQETIFGKKPEPASAATKSESASEKVTRLRSELEARAKEAKPLLDAVNHERDPVRRAEAEKRLDEYEARTGASGSEFKELLAAEHELARENGRQYAVVLERPGQTPKEISRDDTLDRAAASFDWAARAEFRDSSAVAIGKEIVDEHGKTGSAPVKRSGDATLRVVRVPFEEKVPVSAKRVGNESSAVPIEQPKSAEKPEPAAAATAEDAERELAQQQWDSMSRGEREELPKSAVEYFKSKGVNVNEKGKVRSDAGEERSRDVAGVGHLVEEIDANNKLSATEKAAIKGMLAGQSLRSIAKKYGYTAEGVRLAGNRALEKMKKSSTSFEGVGTVEDAIKKGVAEAERRAIEENRDDILRRRESLEERGDAGSAFFGGAPFRIAALEGLFGKPGDGSSGLGARFRRFFFGGLPDAARVAKAEEYDRPIAEAAQNVADAEKDLRRALPGGYDNMPDNVRAALKAALEGDAAAAAGLDRVLPPAVGEAISRMRDQIDRMTDMLIKSGAVDSELVPVLEANKGVYLKRAYRIYDSELGPKWAKDLPPEVKNRAAAWVEKELVNKAGGPVRPADVEGELRRLLSEGTAAENPLKFLATVKAKGGRDLSVLKERKDIPEELRALWGEIDDPVAAFSQTIGSMTKLLASHNFLSRLAREGAGNFLFDKGKLAEFVEKFPGVNPVPIASEKSPTLEPLNGKYTAPEIRDALEAAFTRPVQGAMMRAYSKGAGLTKFSKVVLSHTGQIRNFASNVLTAVANGYWRLGHLPAAAKLIFSDSAEARKEWNELIRLGVVGESLTHRDFVETMRDAYEGRSLASDKGLTPIDRVIKKTLEAGGKLAQKMYEYGDSFFKVYAFYNEVENVNRASPTTPAKEVLAKAAELTRSLNHTYSEIPEGVRKLRNLPLAPFFSFQAETVRTMKNRLLQTFKELKDPATRATGAARLAGMAAAATLPAALAAMSRYALGITSDEDDAFRRTLPEYQKENRIIYVGREGGRAKYIDASKLDPAAYLSDSISAALRSKSPQEAMERAGGELAKPLAQEELLVRPALDIARNKDERGGTVYNESEGPFSKAGAGAVAGRAAEAVLPGGYGPARRFAMGLAGKGEQKSGKEYDATNSAIENVTSVRTEEADAGKWIGQRAAAFATARNDAAKISGEMIRAKGAVSDGDLAAAAGRTEEVRKRAFEEFAKDLRAAELLGVKRGELFRAANAAGVSDADVTAALSGRVPDFKPDVTGTPQERQRARQIRSGLR